MISRTTTSRKSRGPAKKFKAGDGNGALRSPISIRATTKPIRGKPPAPERSPKQENL